MSLNVEREFTINSIDSINSAKIHYSIYKINCDRAHFFVTLKFLCLFGVLIDVS